MARGNMLQQNNLPEIIVFAGPNGSGKSTVTQYAKVIQPYINADEIKRANNCSDLEAAQLAESMREKCVSEKTSFTFETVLSTTRNLNLLRRAKESGFFIRCIYVLTENPDINVSRVKSREQAGGHGVPEDKVRSRYKKALDLIPELIQVCDILHIYDNSKIPFRIFKKRKIQYFFWENEFWTKEKIEELTGLKF
ncbi:MAG: zeta toxin family protein [Treponema sp.]|nr:zeta toxin family protein [Treponema sp.]